MTKNIFLGKGRKSYEKMLILLRFMEIHSVALGYVGDKIRYIRLIRVRLTSEFIFEHGFIGLTRMKYNINI